MRLITLGQIVLLDDAGNTSPASKHKRKLVLLAVLALANGPVERDALIEMFWADDTDRQSARHSLSNALSFLRALLGRSAITMHRAAVVLAPGAIEVDAVELLSASRARNAARVIDLYRGPFLHAASLRGSPALDAWIAETAATITRAMVRAATLRCAALAGAHDWPACADTARVWLDADPCSGDAAVYLLNSLRAAGTPEARLTTLNEYDRLVARLDREFKISPDARVVDIARIIQSKVSADWASASTVETNAVRTITVNDDNAATAMAHVATLEPARPPEPRRQSVRTLAAIGVAIAVLGTAAMAGRRWLPAEAGDRPVVAITDIVAPPGDTASAWLETGLAQMIATDLARYSSLEIIKPARITDVRARAGFAPDASLSDLETADLAKRVGATLAVRGTVTLAHGDYALSLIERDLRSGEVVTSFNVIAGDPIALADRATARLVAAGVSSNARSVGPRFADVETPSPEAYQLFIRSQQAGAEGRFADQQRELDAAIALDSAFGSALLVRLGDFPVDSQTLTRLRRALTRARLTEWDILEQGADAAVHNGEYARSEELGRSLVARYPHDPRAYRFLGGLYQTHGKLSEAEAIFRRALSLDSLGDEAGTGPCVPCMAYGSLVGLEGFTGSLAEATQTAARWIELQPDLPAAHASLAGILSFRQQFDSAIAAERRAIALSASEPVYSGQLLRLLIMARRYSAADSMIARWTKPDADPALRAEAVDGLALLQRERGQLRASIQTLSAQPLDPVSLFERVDALSRLGEYARADQLFHTGVIELEKSAGSAARPPLAPTPLVGDDARSFAWSRALEAEAIAGSGDTLRLRTLADSIQRASARSYYARDWRLHHHVLGRIAMQGKRYAEAEREFAAAQWGFAGWTANLAWLARAQLAQQRPLDAVATLRRAYEGPLDAMGRYEPRSDLDYLMAVAFKSAGRSDSAAVYRAYVATAWRNADPEVRRLLAKRF